MTPRLLRRPASPLAQPIRSLLYLIEGPDAAFNIAELMTPEHMARLDAYGGLQQARCVLGWWAWCSWMAWGGSACMSACMKPCSHFRGSQTEEDTTMPSPTPPLASGSTWTRSRRRSRTRWTRARARAPPSSAVCPRWRAAPSPGSCASVSRAPCTRSRTPLRRRRRAPTTRTPSAATAGALLPMRSALPGAGGRAKSAGLHAAGGAHPPHPLPPHTQPASLPRSCAWLSFSPLHRCASPPLTTVHLLPHLPVQTHPAARRASTSHRCSGAWARCVPPCLIASRCLAWA